MEQFVAFLRDTAYIEWKTYVACLSVTYLLWCQCGFPHPHAVLLCVCCTMVYSVYRYIVRNGTVKRTKTARANPREMDRILEYSRNIHTSETPCVDLSNAKYLYEKMLREARVRYATETETETRALLMYAALEKMCDACKKKWDNSSNQDIRHVNVSEIYVSGPVAWNVYDD